MEEVIFSQQLPNQPKIMCSFQVNPAGVDEFWNEFLQAADADFCEALPTDNQLQDVIAEVGPYLPPDEMPIGLSPTLSSFDLDCYLYDGHELERQVSKTMNLTIRSYSLCHLQSDQLIISRQFNR